MKLNYIIILITGLILISLINFMFLYSRVTQKEREFETVISRIESHAGNPDFIKRETALYRAFQEKRIIGDLRKLWASQLINLFLITLIFIFYILGVIIPVKNFSKQVRNTVMKNRKKIPEKGSGEIRSLIQVYNEMLSKLNDYENQLKSTEKLHGWKQISRIIVHELNNILSPVMTTVDYLQTENQCTEDLNFIGKKIDEMREILKRFRDLSHLPEPDLKPISFHELISEIAYEFPEMKTDIPEENIYILADSLLFREILRNLILNAYESGTSVLVALSAKRNGSHCVIKIKDNGPGISKKNMNKIFEPGFSTKKKNKKNVGVGLSLVKTLIDEHSAVLNCKSREGEGTSFIITIPSE